MRGRLVNISNTVNRFPLCGMIVAPTPISICMNVSITEREDKNVGIALDLFTVETRWDA